MLVRFLKVFGVTLFSLWCLSMTIHPFDVSSKLTEVTESFQGSGELLTLPRREKTCGENVLFIAYTGKQNQMKAELFFLSFY